jgi:ABC-type branched-subunit amino acid transport system substrate-binding protein
MRWIFGSRSSRWSGSVLLALLSAAPLALGQAPGISDSEIKIGSCSALDGPARQLGLQSVLGATMYFHYVNAHGGVNGRKLTLASFDDGYDPERTKACFASVKRENVLVGGLFVGTPTAAKYLPLAEADQMPVVGFFTGAPFLYEPVKREVFNLRASYSDETREQIDSLWGAGIHHIAVLYQDDGFGKAILDGVKAALAHHNAKPAATGSVARNTLDIKGGLAVVRAAKPEAVILAAPYAPAAEIVKQAHGDGWRPLFLTVSFVGTEAFIAAAGKDADGTVITQVVPLYNTELPTVKLYRECLARYMSGAQPSCVSFEAFLNSMVIVEGLRRAGAAPTRGRFLAALESMKDFALGLGPENHLEFSPQRHKGLGRVYTTVVRGGRAEAFSDWAVVLAQK